MGVLDIVGTLWVWWGYLEYSATLAQWTIYIYIYIYGTLTPSHKSGKKWGEPVSGPYAVCRSAYIMYTYVTCNIILWGWWTAKIIVKERFNVSLSFTAKRPSLKTLDRSVTNYIIIWPRKKHYVWDWNLPANRVKAWDFLPHFLFRSYPHWVHWTRPSTNHPYCYSFIFQRSQFFRVKMNLSIKCGKLRGFKNSLNQRTKCRRKFKRLILWQKR